MIKKDYRVIDESVDLSFVNNDLCYASNYDLICDITKKSISKALPILSLIGSQTISLIVIGHFPTKNLDKDIDNFNMLEIGFLYLNIFSFIFILGTILLFEQLAQTLFDNRKPLLNVYQDTKDLIIILVLTVLLPLCLLSYDMLGLIFDDQNNIWYVYTNFIIYSPIFTIFALLYVLNLKLLQVTGHNAYVIAIGLAYYKLHGLMSLIFIKYFNLDLLGILLSYALTSFILYTISLIAISNNIPEFKEISISTNIFKIKLASLNNYLKSALFNGLFTSMEYSAYGIIMLSTYFLDKESFSANVMISNIISLMHVACYGFAETFRDYLGSVSHQHSLKSKKKFLKLFGLVLTIMAIIFCIIITTLEDYIPYLFLSKPTNRIINEFSHIIKYYAIIIFIDYTGIICDGFINGVNPKLRLSLFKGLAKLIVFVPLALMMCYFLDYTLLGFWIGIYIYMVIHTLTDIFYIWNNHDLWIIGS